MILGNALRYVNKSSRVTTETVEPASTGDKEKTANNTAMLIHDRLTQNGGKKSR